MLWENELAKEFKKRDNKTPIGPILGEVLAVEPLKIAIFGGKAFVTAENAYVCSQIVDGYARKADITISSTTNDSTVSFKDILSLGDMVLCLPTTDEQKYFIIDKVVTA